MIRGKKGVEMSMSFVVIIVILLVLALIAIYNLTKSSNLLNSASVCEKNGGTCTPGGVCAEGYYQEFSQQCKDSSRDVCCKSNDPVKADVENLRFNKEQRLALQNPITVTLNKDPAAVSSFEFKEGTEQTINIKFHADLAANSFGDVFLYAVDMNNPNDYHTITSEGLFNIPELNNQPLVNVIICDKDKCKPGFKHAINYKPSLMDSYKKLTFYVVILDKAKISCKNVKEKGTSDEWLKCLKNHTDPKVNPDPNIPDSADLLNKYLPDSDYWLASKSYPITIERKLEVTGVGTGWAQDDTISIICKDKDCTLPEIRLIDGSDKTSIGEFIKACSESTQSDAFYGKQGNGVYNVVGTTLEQTGSPINLDIGGFRIPSNSKLKYVVEQKTIAFVEEKADVKIDRGTMIKNFYNEKKENEILVAGTNNYICARAIVDKKPVYAVSTSPLRIDILPPNIDNDNVRITYPDPIFNVPGSTYDAQYPSIAGSKHFYTNYPRVAISCQDFGQSGCASYDYFLKTGTFINIQMEVNSTTDAITALALQYGINALFQHFASKDPLNTICPSINSNDFRTNSRSTIEIRTEGQGIMCIKVKDKVGNAVLLWKEIYAPSQMMKKIAFEEADKLVNQAVN